MGRLEEPVGALSCIVPPQPGGVCAEGLSFCSGLSIWGGRARGLGGNTGNREGVLLESVGSEVLVMNQ